MNNTIMQVGDIVKINKNITLKKLEENCRYESTFDFLKKEINKNREYIIDLSGMIQGSSNFVRTNKNEHIIDSIIFTVVGHKQKNILDKEEKKYLSGVIRPFKKDVISIEKKTYFERYYISIHTKDKGGAALPDFKDKRMYKNMELNKPYTLKQLGLE